MSKRRKIIAAAVAGVVVVLLVLALIPAPLDVSAAEVRQGRFTEYVEDEGRTHLRDTYPVRAPIGGYLRRVALEPGDEVSAGDRLFVLEPAPAPALNARTREQATDTLETTRARLQAARAELENREAEARFAENEFVRYRRLYERGVVSVTEMDRARSANKRAAAAERAAAAAVEAAHYEMENARAVVEVAEGSRSRDDSRTLDIAAPIGGMVLRRQRCCEGVIQAGETVLELGNLSDLEVRVELLSTDAVRVEPEMRVVIDRWGGDQPLEGRVRRVEPAGFEEISALGVEEQRVPVLVEITSPNEAWAALGEGYRVEARFILWEGENVLQIPTSALFRDKDMATVFVVEDGKARTRRIETGRRSGLWTQVTSGLQAGERIITHPADQIEDGTRVEADLRTYDR